MSAKLYFGQVPNLEARWEVTRQLSLRNKQPRKQKQVKKDKFLPGMNCTKKLNEAFYNHTPS